jgi:nucleoside phosphorylase
VIPIAAALLYATPLEAAPLLAALAHVPATTGQEGVFLAGDVIVAFSGMGLVPARAMAAHLAEEWGVRRIVNVGVAGSLTDALAVGNVVQVSETFGPDPARDGVRLHGFAVAEPGLRAGARLLSRDLPVFDAELRTRLSAQADLVDMEGHAVADECARRDVECLIFKTVSDDATDRATLLANLDRASRRMADFVLGHLSTFRSRSLVP